jgi:sugar lactone lactonase YvrE
MTQFRDEYTLQSPMAVPEGVAFDSKTSRFFATGLLSGTVTQVDARTGEERPFYTPEGQPQQLSGAKVDAERRRLWVCASEIQRMWGGVHVFDVDTGARLATFDLARGGICNDVALDADGVGYVTDSFQPVIYRVDLRDGSAGEYIRDLQMNAPIGRIGLNGIAVTPDDKYLIGGFSSPSKLFVIPRGGGQVHEISLSGDPFAVADDPNFTGADGIVFLNSRLYVVNNGAVQEVTFTGSDWREGSVKNHVVRENGLSTATVAGDELYVIKSEVLQVMHLRQQPRLPFKIYRVPRGAFGTG